MPAEKSSAASSTTNQPPSTNSTAVRRSRQRLPTANQIASSPNTASGTSQPAWSPRLWLKMRTGLRAPPNAWISPRPRK